MVNSQKGSSEPYKNEHCWAPSEHNCPNSSLSIEVLRRFETILQERGLIPQPTILSFNPLWFLAETEKNIFLWRRGCSLIQQDEFAFRIDAKALVSKRLRQLQCCDHDTPFINPLWGLTPPDETTIQQEIEYLLAFMAIWERAEEHVTALGILSDALAKELGVQAQDEEREEVLLPTNAAGLHPRI